MKKAFITFLFAYALFFRLTNVYAFDFATNGSKTVSSLTNDELVDLINDFYDFDSLICGQSSTVIVCKPYPVGTYPQVYTTSSNTYFGLFESGTRITSASPQVRLSKSMTVNANWPLPDASTTIPVSTYPLFLSTVNVLDEDGSSVYYAKNYDYARPSCPTCEVCEDCEECDSMDIDFPISKEEFYVLLVLLALIIFMLFFKWTFSDKRRKR